MKKVWLAMGLLALCAALSGCAIVPAPETPRQEEKVLLTVLAGESTSDPGMADLIHERIEKAFPNVELEWENVDWGERFSVRLNAMLSSGEAPDIIIGKAQDIQAFYPMGALGVFPQELGEPLVDEAVAAGMADGKLYGLVYNQLYQGVLYNKNIFWRYNFEVPQTEAELAAIVDRLNRVGQTPFAAHFQETWHTGNILMQFAIGDVFSKEPDWGDRLRAGEVSFTDPAYRSCAQKVAYQYENTWTDAMQVTQSESDLRFAGEEAVMYLGGSWSVQALKSVAPYRKIGIFPYPNSTGDAKLIAEPNITFMKGAATKYDALIDEIFEMLLSDEELARTVCAFTQTDTCLKGVEVDSLDMIREDIERYRAEDRIVSASIGNNQLIWAFQYDCAELLLSHLRGEQTLDSVLTQWDLLRDQSSTQAQ
ncbi:MAG: extracellular solute-binding protein [Clostridia bacterium]|nr:extracellular solute-binding protein [Clostridia bacterium]